MTTTWPDLGRKNRPDAITIWPGCNVGVILSPTIRRSKRLGFFGFPEDLSDFIDHVQKFLALFWFEVVLAFTGLFGC